MRTIYKDKETIITLNENRDKIIKTKLRKSISQDEIDSHQKAFGLGLAPEIYSFSVKHIEMEYIKGITLDAYSKSNQDRSKIKKKVKKAMSKLFENGIQHNNLTGSNIVITPKEEIKIIDYEYALLHDRRVPIDKRDYTITKMF